MTGAEIERLYDEHADTLFASALTLLRGEAEACDVVQDVFRKLVERPSLLAGVVDLRGFLLRTTYHQVIDHIRRRDSRRRTLDAFQEGCCELFESHPEADEQAFREALSAALDQLPQDQRVIVHLKLWEGMTFERIADVLQLPVNTAASRYRYGLDKLRTQLRPLYDEIR